LLALHHRNAPDAMAHEQPRGLADRGVAADGDQLAAHDVPHRLAPALDDVELGDHADQLSLAVQHREPGDAMAGQDRGQLGHRGRLGDLQHVAGHEVWNQNQAVRITRRGVPPAAAPGIIPCQAREDHLMEINRVAVIGAGTVGSQLAYQCALGGLEVRLASRREATLEAGMENARRVLSRRVEKGTLSEADCAAAVARVSPTTSPADAAEEADIAIEAVTEQLETKHEVFKQLDEAAPPHAILASTSST